MNTKSALALALALTTAASTAAAFEVEPEARLHLDYGAWQADRKTPDDGFLLRKATFGLEGKFNKDWSFELEYGFANDGEFTVSDGEFRDIAVKYDGWDAGDLEFGQFKVPFGLSEDVSSNATTMIERPLPVDAFGPGRRMGVAFSHEGNDWAAGIMGFGSDVYGDGGKGVATRFTVAPYHAGSSLLHFGASLVIEDAKGEPDFDTAPEARPGDVKLVNTGGIEDASRVNRMGLDAAWQTGPVLVQGEWIETRVDRRAGADDVSLSGWYVSASWFLTGQVRRYDGGEFKAIKSFGTAGAWELTGRYSHIDLDDSDVRGGRESNWTVGLNYYLNKHLRVMANYIAVDSERKGKSDDPDILLLRLQLVL